MSPSKPAGVLKVRVPRQNAQRLGPAVTQEVRTLAREQGINVQLPPPVQVQPTSAGPSSVRFYYCTDFLSEMTHEITSGQCLRMELDVDYRASGQRSAMGCRHATVSPATSSSSLLMWQIRRASTDSSSSKSQSCTTTRPHCSKPHGHPRRMGNARMPQIVVESYSPTTS